MCGVLQHYLIMQKIKTVKFIVVSMKPNTKEEIQEWIAKQKDKEYVLQSEAVLIAQQLLYWMQVAKDLQIIINDEKEGVTSLS